MSMVLFLFIYTIFREVYYLTKLTKTYEYLMTLHQISSEIIVISASAEGVLFSPFN